MFPIVDLICDVVFGPDEPLELTLQELQPQFKAKNVFCPYCRAVVILEGGQICHHGPGPEHEWICPGSYYGRKC